MSREKSKRSGRRSQRRKNLALPVLLALGGLVLLGVAALALIRGRGGSPESPSEVKGSPALKADQEKVDLGDVPLGTPVQVQFTLTNVGDQPLSFTGEPYIEVLEGCWPPVPAIGSMALQPGQSTTLSMEFMMHGDMGGKHDFRVHLASSDPARPDYELTVLSNWVD